MKKCLLTSIVLAVALLGVVYAATSAGGSAADPLISRTHADGAYTAQVLGEADEKAAKRYNALYQIAETKLKAKYNELVDRLGGTASGSYQGTLSDIRLKRGDMIAVSVGSGFRLLAGAATVSSTGTVIDVTAGAVHPAGVMTAGRRYLVGEGTTATIMVTSPTAVLSLEGYHTLTTSAATDYNELAGAMKTLGLFQGTDTGYGSGYDLEKPPTRIQGLVMFLRLIGEEKAALASAAVHPFQDVPAWASRYVAYAYERGYTKGVDAARFGSDAVMGAADYVTFVLRALGYTDSGTAQDFAWSTVLQDGLNLGVLTVGEQKLLLEEPFLRAHVVYLSYFALDASFHERGGTLQSVLVADGVFDQIIVDMVRNAVSVQRLL